MYNLVYFVISFHDITNNTQPYIFVENNTYDIWPS